MKVIPVGMDRTQGGNHAACRTDDGGFARTVRADQRKHFAILNVERDIVQHLMSVIRGGEILNL